MLFSLGFMSVSAAASYTNSKGSVRVVCGKYKKTFKAKKYKNNFSLALVAALDTARKKATVSKRATVTVSKGHYRLDRTIKVYSNTTLNATGSYFRYYGNLLRNGFDRKKAAGRGYTSAKNITIKGGEWEQLIEYKYAGTSDSTKWHSTFRFAHCYNIKVYNAKFKNNYNCHDIEIAGVKNSEFYNNTFYNTKDVNGVSNNGGRESFQIDVTTIDAMPYFPSYDKTPCKNIDIHHNTFKNKFRAVGSHHAITGKTYNNISVHHNKMTNIAGICVYAVYWTNSKVYSNTMTSVGFGVDLRSMIGGGADNFYNPNNLSYVSAEKAVASSKNYIYDNNINIRTAKNILQKTCGIRAVGDYYDKDSKATGTKAGVYKMYNVRIGADSLGNALPNTISGNMSSGILMSYGVNAEVKNNYVDMSDSAKSTSIGIELRGCENSSVSFNTIFNGVKSSARGIYAYESAANTPNVSLNISDNQITDFGHSGVMLKSASFSTVARNLVTNCGSYAVLLKSATDTALSDNTLTGSAYGVYASDKSDNLTLSNNNISECKTGLYALNLNGVNMISNSVTAKSNSVYLKACDNFSMTENTLTSELYGVRIENDCSSVTMSGNTVNSSDECVYYNGSTSRDKETSKLLKVTGNILNCPASSAAVRVVYDNTEAEIHSNTRSDGAAPVYRFKGDGESKYRFLTGDMNLDNLALEETDGGTLVNWTTSSKPDGYRVYLGENYLCSVSVTECVISDYNGESVTVVPYKTYGNITHLGVPMTVSAS